MNAKELLENLQKNLSTAKNPVIDNIGHIYLTIESSELLKASKYIKELFKDTHIILDQSFGIDFPDNEQIEMIYSWWHFDFKLLFSLKFYVPYSNLVLPSIVEDWDANNFHERETHEMLGIKFEGHPNLTALLLPEELFGKTPMRKSFKINRER